MKTQVFYTTTPWGTSFVETFRDDTGTVSITHRWEGDFTYVVFNASKAHTEQVGFVSRCYSFRHLRPKDMGFDSKREMARFILSHNESFFLEAKRMNGADFGVVRVIPRTATINRGLLLRLNEYPGTVL